jgi:hypothetical protein
VHYARCKHSARLKKVTKIFIVNCLHIADASDREWQHSEFADLKGLFVDLGKSSFRTFQVFDVSMRRPVSFNWFLIPGSASTATFHGISAKPFSRIYLRPKKSGKATLAKVLILQPFVTSQTISLFPIVKKGNMMPIKRGN